MNVQRTTDEAIETRSYLDRYCDGTGYDKALQHYCLQCAGTGFLTRSEALVRGYDLEGVTYAEVTKAIAHKSHRIGPDEASRRVDCIDCGLEPDEEGIEKPCYGEPRTAGY